MNNRYFTNVLLYCYFDSSKNIIYGEEKIKKNSIYKYLECKIYKTLTTF